MKRLDEIENIKKRFNFEALNSIYQIAYFEGANETLELLEAYIDMSRSCNGELSEFEMIKCEVDHVRSYLKIQKAMRNDRLKYSLFLSQNVIDKYIVKDSLYMATHIIVETVMNYFTSQVFMDINISSIGDLDNIFFSINIYHTKNQDDEGINEIIKQVRKKLDMIEEFEGYTIDSISSKEIFFKFFISTE